MRLQTSSAGLAIGDADNRYLRLAGGDLTGAVTLTKAAPSLYPADSTMPPAYSVAQEWGNAGKTWTALQVSATNTASGSGSKIADFQLSGVSIVTVTKSGMTVGVFGSSGNILTVYGDTQIYRNSSTALNSAFGHFYLGSSGAQLQQSLTFGWHDGSGAAVSMDTGLQRDAAGVVKFTDGAGTLRDWKARRGSLSEYLDITEMSAPAAPAANTARLYVEDNGSGKTRLMVLFPTGAAQVLATEP